MTEYHPSIINSDVLLSNWIFWWTVVYCIIKLIPNTFDSLNNNISAINPTFAMLVALSYQFYALVQILVRTRPFHILPQVLAKFCLLTFLFKLLPLYCVLSVNNTSINKNHRFLPLNEIPGKIKETVFEGIPAFILVFIAYIVYITRLKLDFFEIYDDLTESYVKNDNRLVFYKMLVRVWGS